MAAPGRNRACTAICRSTTVGHHARTSAPTQVTTRTHGYQSHQAGESKFFSASTAEVGVSPGACRSVLPWAAKGSRARSRRTRGSGPKSFLEPLLEVGKPILKFQRLGSPHEVSPEPAWQVPPLDSLEQQLHALEDNRPSVNTHQIVHLQAAARIEGSNVGSNQTSGAMKGGVCDAHALCQSGLECAHGTQMLPSIRCTSVTQPRTTSLPVSRDCRSGDRRLWRRVRGRSYPITSSSSGYNTSSQIVTRPSSAQHSTSHPGGST